MRNFKGRKVFFVDPMSFNNLEQYDSNLVSKFPKNDIIFFGNIKMKKPPLGIVSKLIFTYSNKSGIKKKLSYAFSILKFYLLVIVVKPKIIHFQWFKAPLFDYVFLHLIKSIRPKLRIIYTAHNILPHNSGEKFKNIFLKIYNKVDKVIVHDNSTKLELIRSFKLKESKIAVILHGLLNIPIVEKENYKLSKEQINFRNKVVFLFIGNISEYKGIDLIIEVWNNYEQINSNNKIQLLICGHDKDNLLSELKPFKNVTICNKFLTDEEFVMFIRKSDIVLLPYKKISQSGVLLTVLNEEKNVIVSNIGGLTQPFDVSDIGWILEDTSADSLKEKILMAVIDFKNKNTDFAKIREYYSWGNISKKTYLLYQDLINN